jgi:hypothetical protein
MEIIRQIPKQSKDFVIESTRSEMADLLASIN